MHLAVTANRLSADLLAHVPVLQTPKFPPPHPDPGPLAAIKQPASLRELADGWCGTVPRHFPIPQPKGGDDDGGWCGTVPRRIPLPVPPTPPLPWQDLGAAAQRFF